MQAPRRLLHAAVLYSCWTPLDCFPYLVLGSRVLRTYNLPSTDESVRELHMVWTTTRVVTQKM